MKKPKEKITKTIYKCTGKQENFCIHYVEYGSGSNAYKHAYDTKNMKANTIYVRACEMLKKSKIQVRIAELRQPMMDNLKVTVEKTLNRLMQGQEFDFRKLYKADGTLKHPHEMDDDTAKAIVGSKHDSEGNILEYKIIDVKGCTELIGKHQNIFEEKDQKPVEIHINYGHRRKPDEEGNEEGS